MAFDLTLIPPPQILETLDYDTVLAQILAQFRTRYPDYTSIVEGDPGYSVLQAMAWQETMTRKRINDAARAVLATHAVGADLDNLAALMGLTRQVVTPADPDADPPVEEVLETDDRLRDRLLNTLESIVPGSVAWYRGYVLEADSGIKDAVVSRTAPGTITIYVQGIDPVIPSSALQTTVSTYLNVDARRFLCDTLVISPVTTVSYSITAQITVRDGFVAADVLQKVQDAVAAFATEREVIGQDIPLSAFYSVMSVEEVSAVSITAPTADVTATSPQVPVLTGTATITTA